MLELPDYIIPNGDESKSKDGAYFGTFKSLVVGSGDISARTDSSGSWWGAEKFADAPASITNAGVAKFSSISISGYVASGGAAADINNNTTTISGGKITTNSITASQIQTNTLTVGTNVGIGTAQTAGNVTTIIGNTITTGYVNALGITAGSVNASNITAGTITGSTLRTAAPGAGVGSSVVITGGNNQMIHLYYNETEKGTIKGYTTEGSEETYVEISAVSGRKLKLKNSHIECNGNFNPSAADTYNLGGMSIKWQELWAGKIFQSTPSAGDVQVFSFAYIEMGLLPKEMQKKYLKGENGCMQVGGIPPEHIKLPFKKGTVLIWKNGKLQEGEKDEDERVVAIADHRGLPIILGAEPVRVIGRVKCGDYIVSAKNGCGKVAKNPDKNMIIGKALAGSNSDKEKSIIVMIKF